MRNRFPRFTALTLVASTLGLGWQIAWSSAVYLPHRMLPSFVPATLNGAAASFTPHYRFRPLGSRRGPVAHSAARMPAPRRAVGYGLPANPRYLPGSHWANRSMGQQWPNDFRFRPMRPRTAPTAYYLGPGPAMPTQFARRSLHNDTWRFSSAYTAPPWNNRLPAIATSRYAATLPAPPSRYRPGWRLPPPGYRAAGYRFRPLAEPKRRFAARTSINARSDGRFAGITGLGFRPVVSAQRSFPNGRGQSSIRFERTHLIGMPPPQRWFDYRFRPDRRFMAAGQSVGYPAFATQQSASGAPRFGRLFETGSSSRAPVWRPLEDRYASLAGHPTAVNQGRQFSSDDGLQPGWHIQADQL